MTQRAKEMLELADLIASVRVVWVPMSGDVRNVTFTLDQADRVIEALRLAAQADAPGGHEIQSSDGGSRQQPFVPADAVGEASAPNVPSGKQEGRTGFEIGASQTPGSSTSSAVAKPIIAGQASSPSETNSDLPQRVPDIRQAYVELAALIPDPENPSTSDWPCVNPADRECLQKAYRILQDAVALSRPDGGDAG